MALEHIFKYDVEPARVAANIIEPVMGDGGFYIAPPEFPEALGQLCDQHGIVLVIGESQTGFARTGKLIAIEHSGAEPDLMPMAKSLACEFPLAAVVGKASIMDAPAQGGLGGMYAGSPISCAFALAVLDVIEHDNLCDRVATICELIVITLRSLARQVPAICGVRNLEAMVAMELVTNGDPRQPDADLTKPLTKRAAEKGLVLPSCGLYANVIRFFVPLTASDAIAREGLGIVAESLREFTAARVLSVA